MNREISNLKGQLKIQTKQHNDMKNTIATQSEASDHDGYEPIPLELDTSLLNRSQIFEDNEAINHRIGHDSNRHASEVTVGNTTHVINYTLNSQNPKLHVHVPASTDYSGNQNHNLPRNKDSAQGPILIINDSMLRGIKEMKLSSKIFIRKEGTIKDINSYIHEFDGATPCTKIVIHIGINDVFKSFEVEIMEGIRDLINILKDKWPNAQHLFSGIILHNTNSRKNLIINRINQEIKLLSTTMNFTYLYHTNVTLSSGLIDEEAYFHNLHLSNSKGIRKLANNLKIALNLKSRSQTGIGQPKHIPLPQQQYIKHDYKLNQKSRRPSYAEALKYHPQPAFQQQQNQFLLMQVSISSITIPPPPRHDLKGAKTLPPGQSLCTKTLPRDKTGSQKPHPRDIKLENFMNVSINCDTI